MDETDRTRPETVALAEEVPPLVSNRRWPPKAPEESSAFPRKRAASTFLSFAFVFLALALTALFAAEIAIKPSVPATVPAEVIDAEQQWRYWPGAKATPGNRSTSKSNRSPRYALPRLTAHAAILVEPETMTVLYAHNEHARRAPASTTKIMTALLALEYGRLQDTVTVSQRAAAVPGSSVHLRPGQRILLGDLLIGLLMRSGNDAAVAIAEHLAGSEEAFTAMMNERARQLGARNTHFRNAHGLDEDGHYSTAFDLAHLARLAMTYPTFRDIVARHEYVVEGQGRTWRNTNRLLWRFEGAEGVKTGTTGRAGNCLVAAASRDGVRLISVVLGSSDRWQDTATLLEWGFANFHVLTAATGQDILIETDVPGGIGPLRARPSRDLKAILHDGEIGRARMEVVLHPSKPPIAAGQVVGTARIQLDDDVRGEVPLVAASTVVRWTPLRALWRWLQQVWNPAAA